MSAPHELLKRTNEIHPCVTIIGMAGSGKSTIGQALANRLGWAFVDTDSLIEAAYGVRLQMITDSLPRNQFLDAESDIVRAMRASRAVIATGGSVVYRERSMEYLQDLGVIVCLDAPVDVIAERISQNPDRGLVIKPGQTLADLYRERKILYDKFANIHVDATLSPSEIAESIIERLPAEYLQN